jgi:predicted DNA binding CopG/RHH family protein
MPGQRAANVKLRNIGADDELWEAVKAKAAAEGLTASEAVRRLMRDWVAE